MFSNMDNTEKKYKQAFSLFTISQFFMMLGLLEYGSYIKAISEIMGIFIIFQLVAFIMMIAAATKLHDFNKNLLTPIGA